MRVGEVAADAMRVRIAVSVPTCAIVLVRVRTRAGCAAAVLFGSVLAALATTGTCVGLAFLADFDGFDGLAACAVWIGLRCLARSDATLAVGKFCGGVVAAGGGMSAAAGISDANF